jgi:protein-disulfide isomerase
MTWSHTRSWWQIVREVVAEVEQRKDGQLPWRSSYAEIFPTPASLLAALNYYWRLQVSGQVDERRDYRSGDEYDRKVGDTYKAVTLREFADAHSGLCKVLANGLDAATASVPPPAPAAHPLPALGEAPQPA